MKNDKIIVYESIKNILKEGFIKFYGENYREKINEVFSLLNIVFVSNQKSSQFNLKSKYKINSLKSISRALKKRCVKDLTKNVTGRSAYIKGKPIVVLFGEKINLLTLIHEINHLLHHEKILKVKNEKINDIFISYGIRQKKPQEDLVYEVINEILSLEIYEIIKDKLKSYDIDFKINSGYLQLDYMTAYIVSITYYNLKNKIKECLISGSGEEIEKIITKENYKLIDDMFHFFMEKMSQESIKIDDLFKSITKEEIEKIENIHKKVRESIIYYNNYESQLQKYADQESLKGTVRKI